MYYSYWLIAVSAYFPLTTVAEFTGIEYFQCVLVQHGNMFFSFCLWVNYPITRPEQEINKKKIKRLRGYQTDFCKSWEGRGIWYINMRVSLTLRDLSIVWKACKETINLPWEETLFFLYKYYKSVFYTATDISHCIGTYAYQGASHLSSTTRY